MAHSVRNPVPEIRLDLKNGAIVECHKNNVFKIHADILVVSSNGSVESGAREKVGWQEWDKRKRKASPIIIHDWKSVKILTSDCQSNFHFSKVYVVQVPVFIKDDSKKWLEEYQKMITSMLTRTENRGMTSITIPLLGTNAGGAPKDGCVRRVMEAVFEFKKFKSLRKINLVVQGWQEVTLVQDIIAEKLGQTSDADKNVTQNNLIPSSKSHDILAVKAVSSEGRALRDVSSRNCSYCGHYTTSRFELPCSHVYCIECVPGDKGCPQCEVEKFNKDDGYKLSNRGQSSSQQTHGEDPEIRNIQRNKMVSSDNKEEQESRHENEKFDSKKSSSNHNVRDIERENIGSSVSLYNCSRCGHYTTSRFELSCSHMFCIFCEPGFKSCPQCEESDENLNKQEENSAEPGNRIPRSREETHEEDLTQSVKKYHCKSCSGYTFNKLKEMPCHHFCCFRCFANLICQQCKTYQCNKQELNAEPGNSAPSTRQETHGEDSNNSSNKGQSSNQQTQREDPEIRNIQRNKKEELESRHENEKFDSKKSSSNHHVRDIERQKIGSSEGRALIDVSLYNCSHCGHYTTSRFELSCSHVFCIFCEPGDKGCPLCKVENKKSNKEKEKSTHGEDRAYTFETYYCKSCLGNVTIKLSELPCHHFCCFRCFYKHSRYNNPQNCQQCKAEQCNKDEAVSTEPGNRVLTYRDNPIEEKCQRCDSSLANNSPVQQACGHTFCARCSAKDCKDPSCNEGFKGDTNQTPDNDSSCNKEEVQSSSEINPQDVRAKTALLTCYRCSVNLATNSPVQLACGHTFCAKCASKGCIDPSCEEEPDLDHDINLEESRSSQDLSDNHSNRRSDTSEQNHSSRNGNGSDGNHRDTHRSRYPNGSDGNHRDRHRSRDGNGSDGNHRDNHRSRDGNDRDGNHRDRHRSRYQNGSDGNHRDNHRSRDGNGSDGNHRDRHRSRYQNGSDGNHRDKHRSRDRNGSDGNHRDNHRSRDGNDRDGNLRDNHSSRDRNGSNGNHRDNHSSRDRNEGQASGGRPKNGDLPPKDAEKNEMCTICMDHIIDPKKLNKCGHVFCQECIDDCFKLHKPVCPSCGTMYGVTIGNMPPGTMDVRKKPAPIESFKKYGSYCITYQFNAGIQGSEHPNPGVGFNGATRKAYLPASPEGVEVCKMLKVAFKRCLTFTIGRSPTTGRENVIIWNDIHHKTSMVGGSTQFGYPDPTYLNRVKEELASKGVTLADIDGVSDETEIITVP